MSILQARIQVSLFIPAPVNFRNVTPAYSVQLTSGDGPSPGLLILPTTGLDVTFPELVTPALCLLENLDPTNFYDFGLRDIVTNEYYPLGEVQAGEVYLVRLSRFLGKEYHGGTATNNAVFHLRANTASLNGRVSAFSA